MKQTLSKTAFPQVIVVEASAGSGKTYALARRYLELLINPQLTSRELPLKTILAITFTNKAAIEMKERILYFLKRIALDAFVDPQEKREIIQGLGVGEEAARRKAFLIMDELLRNYNFFQVQTIDSFINAILSGCAFKLDLSAHFVTEREHSDYIAMSLDTLIDRAGEDKKVRELFLAFLRQYLYIEYKTGWFPKQKILEQMLGLFNRSNTFDGSFTRARGTADLLLKRKKSLLEKMRALKEVLPEATYTRFRGPFEAFLEQNREGFAIDAVSGYFGYDSLPVKKGVKIPAKTRTLWEEVRRQLRSLCELESACVFNAYVDIFNLLMRDMHELSSKDDVLFLESLNKEARRLLSEKGVSLPELYYRLATRFRHFLIDEFQDTSRLQWRNLFQMAEEALSTGGSLFYVGDRKQAIYRFRGGDASLIDEVGEGFKKYNLISSSLRTNYRSLRQIVEYNNRVFSESNLRLFLQKREESGKGGLAFNEEDKEYIVRVFAGAHQDVLEGKEGGYVRVRSLDCQSKEETHDAVRRQAVDLAHELRRRFAPEDVAFLVRKNDEVELLTGWLLEEGIPVASEKTLNIRHNPYIKEIISFLSFLHSPIDNLSFASFILGDIFSAASGIPKERLGDFIFSLGLRKKVQTYVYREFRSVFPAAWDTLIEEFFRSVGHVPLYELVVSIFGRWRVLERFPDYQGFFMRLLELVATEEEKRPSIESFLEYFNSTGDEQLYVNAATSRAVRILTIHKAKGLEFPAVVVPFLTMNVKPDKLAVVPGPDALRLLRLKKKYNDFSPALEELSRQEYIKAFIDELNSFYVALTRAVEELYILVPGRADYGTNPAAWLLPENDSEAGSRRKALRPSAVEKAARFIEPVVYKDWIGFLKDEFADETAITNRRSIVFGELMHYLLSFVGNTHEADSDALIDEAVERARAEFASADNLAECAALVKKIIASSALTSYFDVPGGRVYTEKDLADKQGRSFRIDRLILTPTEAVVVDYKSTASAGADYREQVRNYMRLVQEMYPNAGVRGVLIYLDTREAEEVES